MSFLQLRTWLFQAVAEMIDWLRISKGVGDDLRDGIITLELVAGCASTWSRTGTSALQQ